MKTFLFPLFLALALGCFAQTATAQTASDEAAVKTFWKEVWMAYEAGNVEKMWASYTENADEIGPDGSLTSGKPALRASWDAMMKMVDEKPKFTYAAPAVRFITPEVAIITWDSEADIKIGGQQVGGKTKGMAVVHKIRGQWMIEFDSITPIYPMQAPPSGN